MKFEDFLSEINGFGRFQKTILLINFFGRFSLVSHFMLNNFIAVVPSHHCKVSFLDDSDVFENLTQDEILTVMIPKQDNGTFASCRLFSEPQFQLLLEPYNATDLPVVRCQNGWVFDHSVFKSSLATEWDLVCEKVGLNRVVATIFFIGVMFGAAAFGSLSAMVGRKKMLLVSYALAFVFALASALSTSFIMFMVFWFCTGLSTTGIVIISTVLNVEWVDIQNRKLVGVIDSMSWTSAIMCFSVLAYCITDWRWLIVASTLPTIPAFILTMWIPESARWLITNGKLEEAYYYLRKCAVMNKREDVIASIKPEQLCNASAESQGDRKYSYLDLLRTPKIRRIAMLTGSTWFCIAVILYGINFNVGHFGLSIHVTQFVFGVIEIPAKLIVYYLLDKIGRRSTEIGALLLLATCLFINIFIPRDKVLARTVVATLGRGFSASCFTTLILYSSELYPTVLRQNGMGYNSFVARLGGALVPLLLILDNVWHQLSQVVFSCVALLAVFIVSQLPETRNKCLPETIEDIEGRREKEEEEEVDED